MATITLDGEGFGDYSIAGLIFHDGQTDVDVLTVKQAYLLHALGAKVDGDVQILTPPTFEDETAPAPEPAAPSHSSADDLAAIGQDASWDSIGEQVTAEPQLEDVQDAGLADDQYSVSPVVDAPVVDPALDTPVQEPTPEPQVVITEPGTPDTVTEQPQAPQDAPVDVTPDTEATPVVPEPETPAEPEATTDAFEPTAPEPTVADDVETPEALEDRIPAAPEPTDTDAPAPVLSESGDTVTEAAVLPSDTTPEEDTAGRHAADESDATA